MVNGEGGLRAFRINTIYELINNQPNGEIFASTRELIARFRWNSLTLDAFKFTTSSLKISNVLNLS